MKSIMRSFIIAFSMYSKVPMPRCEWDEKSMRYAMCFFPFVGILIGGLEFLWFFISQEFAISKMITTAVFVIIPVLVTGGIHIDGFLDTVDALSSNQSRENKIRILSDPNSGAFAIIFCVIYFMLYFSFFYEINKASILIVCLGFIMSRSLSAISVVTFKKAKDTGLVHTFSSGSIVNTVRLVNIIVFLITAIVMLLINTLLAAIAISSALLVFCYYYKKAYRNFGGINGDLCGYFLQLCELILLICIVGGSLIWF